MAVLQPPLLTGHSAFRVTLGGHGPYCHVQLPSYRLIAFSNSILSLAALCCSLSPGSASTAGGGVPAVCHEMGLFSPGSQVDDLSKPVAI